jgi:hypothetical protein
MSFRSGCVLLLVAACGEMPSSGTEDSGTPDSGAPDAGNEQDGGVACSTGNAQPDLCSYGSFCDDATMTCAAAPIGMCSNITPSNPATQWDPTISMGPVIYAAIDEMDVASDCVSGTPFTLTLLAYTASGQTFPANKSNLPGLFYFTTTGAPTDVTTLLKQSNYLVDPTTMTNASMTFTLCSSAASSIVAGFAFTGGNPFCAEVHNP